MTCDFCERALEPCLRCRQPTYCAECGKCGECGKCASPDSFAVVEWRRGATLGRVVMPSVEHGPVALLLAHEAVGGAHSMWTVCRDTGSRLTCITDRNLDPAAQLSHFDMLVDGRAGSVLVARLGHDMQRMDHLLTTRPDPEPKPPEPKPRRALKTASPEATALAVLTDVAVDLVGCLDLDPNGLPSLERSGDTWTDLRAVALLIADLTTMRRT